MQKGKPSTLYTCCEECYYNYVKGTDNEASHIECDAVGNCNCDYQLYNSTCDFEDCSVKNDLIRVSIVDHEGLRCKSKNNTFHVKPGHSYTILVENLTPSSSKIAIDSCMINEEELKISKKENFSKYIVESTVESPNSENTVDNIKLTVSLYKQFQDSLTFRELQCNNGVLADETGTPWMKLGANAESKYKATLNLDIYESKPTDNQTFDIVVIHTDESIDVYSKDDEFNITI
jgi:hypothetical protein